MTLTVQEYAARALEKETADLIKAAQATPADKQTWKPLERGRTVVDQVAECAMINTGSAQMVADRAWPDVDMAQWRQTQAALDTLDKAVAQLQAGTAALTAAIRATPDDALGVEITLPWATCSLAEVFLMPLWNMSYHEGQINYIQTLCEG